MGRLNLQLHDASCAVTDRMCLLPSAHEPVRALLQLVDDIRIHLLRCIALLWPLHTAHAHGIHAVRHHHVIIVVGLLHSDMRLHTRVQVQPTRLLSLLLPLPLSLHRGRRLIVQVVAHRHSAECCKQASRERWIGVGVGARLCCLVANPV